MLQSRLIKKEAITKCALEWKEVEEDVVVAATDKRIVKIGQASRDSTDRNSIRNL